MFSHKNLDKTYVLSTLQKPDLVTWGRQKTDHGQPQEQRGQARTELAQLEAEASSVPQ
jgi:hypothetical protein